MNASHRGHDTWGHGLVFTRVNTASNSGSATFSPDDFGKALKSRAQHSQNGSICLTGLTRLSGEVGGGVGKTKYKTVNKA